MQSSSLCALIYLDLNLFPRFFVSSPVSCTRYDDIKWGNYEDAEMRKKDEIRERKEESLDYFVVGGLDTSLEQKIFEIHEKVMSRLEVSFLHCVNHRLCVQYSGVFLALPENSLFFWCSVDSRTFWYIVKEQCRYWYHSTRAESNELRLISHVRLVST